MSSILKRLRDEPAYVGSVVTAAAALLAAFGFNLDGDQVASITAFIAVVTGGAVRSQVVPTKALNELAAIERISSVQITQSSSTDVEVD